MNLSANSRKILVFLVIPWLLSVVSLYYISNKPITPEIGIQVVLIAWKLAVALLILSVSGGLGGRLLPLDEVHPSVRGTLQAALGLGLMSTIALTVGATLGVESWIIGMSLVLPCLFLYRDILRWWQSWSSLGKFWHNGGRLGRMAGIAIGLIFASTLIVALAPPLAFDALAYHLEIPSFFLDAGRVIYSPGNVFWGMSHLCALLFTWAAGLGGVEAAAVLGWLFGVLAVAGTFSWGVARWGSQPGWVAGASLLSGFSLAISLSWAYVDWLVILYGLCFLVTLDEGTLSLQPMRQGLSQNLNGETLQSPTNEIKLQDKASTKMVFLAGLFSGMAVGTKYTAGILVVAGVGWILWRGLRSGHRIARYVFVFLMGAFLASFPWFLKNYLATGNPVYPLLFPSGAMDSFRLGFYQSHPVTSSLWEQILLPLFATFRGVQGGPGYGASIGPLFLGLGLLVWLGWESFDWIKRHSIKVALAIVLPGVVIWAVAGRISDLLSQTRLYFAIFPGFALLAAAGYAAIDNTYIYKIRIGRIAGVFVLLVLWFNAAQVGMETISRGALEVILGLQTEEQYLENNLGWYAVAMQTIRDLPENAKVVMLWEPRGLYCAPRCESDEVLDRWEYSLASQSDASQILSMWRTTGYTHLLYYQKGAEFIQDDDIRYPPQDWGSLSDLLTQLPDPTDFGNTYKLYRLSP